MKRVLSSLLLFVFIFHVIGYYLFFWGFLYQANIKMKQRLNAEEYSLEETITFKIPLTVPYYTESKGYERTQGAFEHDGEFYKLIKQKLASDTLYVVCIKDAREKSIVSAMTDFVQLTNDLPAGSQQTIKLMGSFIKDYVPAGLTATLTQTELNVSIEFLDPLYNLLTADSNVVTPPPDFIS